MTEEIKSKFENGAWKLVSLGARPIHCNWIFKVKELVSLIDQPRFRVRLVVKGYIQKEGSRLFSNFCLCI